MGRLRHAVTYGQDEHGIAYGTRVLWRRRPRSSRRSRARPRRAGKPPAGRRGPGPIPANFEGPDKALRPTIYSKRPDSAAGSIKHA